MANLQTRLSPPTGNASQDELNALIGLYSQSRLDEALGLAAQLIGTYPCCEITHNIAGALVAAMGRHEKAVQLYDRAIAMAPDYVEAYNNRGNSLKELKRTAEALASYDTAIGFLPDYAEAHLNRAIVLRMEKRLEEALAAVGTAIHHNPGLPQAHSNRGNILYELNRFEDALAEQDRAIMLDPGFAHAHLNRGNCLASLKRLPEAVDSYERAIALSPAHALAHRCRASALKDLDRLAEALAGFDKAFELDRNDLTALSEAVVLQARMCDWTDPSRSTDLHGRVRGGEAIPPFHLFAIADEPALQLSNARGWARDRFPQQRPVDHLMPRATDGKVRIGYFSADFYNHATMALMIRMLELHDKARFEIHAFSYGPQVHDAVSERVVHAVDAFHDISTLDDAAAAQLAREKGIDIAVDLKGYTENGRPGIFAHRPARHQAAYLGYPGTTGADYIDYLIADRVIVPESARTFYAEKVLYLPGSYQVNDSQRPTVVSPSRAEFGLPEDGFVFCCLNNSYKITPAEFDIWMRLLSRVDGSVLWLLEDNPWAAANLRREAETRSVDAARLVFAKRVPVHEHLARQACADLFLDTFNVNAHTTASEALWAGLPVVTKLGKSLVARVAGSLLHAVGLPELVTEATEDYEALAFDLATNPTRLAAIKSKLSASRTTAPLFDTQVFTANIERLFSEMCGGDRSPNYPADHLV